MSGRQVSRCRLTAGLVAAAALAAAASFTSGPAASAAAAVATSPAPAWKIVKTVNSGVSSDFTAVTASSASTGWAFDGGGYPGAPAPVAYQHTGSNWTSWTKYPGFHGEKGEKIVAVAATAANDVWAVSEIPSSSTGQPASGRAFYWNGHTWATVKTFSKGIGGLAVLGPKNVWVFGDQEAYPSSLNLGAYHYNGSWSQAASGKGLAGGSALSAADVWAFHGTSVYQWTGSAWHGTSVASLLPKKTKLNAPQVTGILALSKDSVYAIGNGSAEDDGGPTVVLHYNGHKWAREASGNYGYGTVINLPTQAVSSDGGAGLWLPQPAGGGAATHMTRYASGALKAVSLPVSGQLIDLYSVSRIPGTSWQLTSGFTHSSDYSSATAVILEYVS
jgi:hypothetical protein